MAHIASDKGVVDLVLEALRSLDLEPMLIPHGRTDELRGGLACFELRSGEGVDAAILLSKVAYDKFPIDKSRALHRVDYAVRGTIRGVLSGRVLTRTTLELKGLLRKRLAGLRWEIPLRELGSTSTYLHKVGEGQPPSPGELWEGGPHQKLTERLNGDAKLMGALKTLVKGRIGSPLILSIISDGWGESIRIGGNLWLKTPDLLSVYTSQSYLGMVDRISYHLKGVRRSFGGITF
jgi:hypothetical protein